MLPTKEEAMNLDIEEDVDKRLDTKKKSLSEALANIFPGYWIAFALNLLVLPFFAADMAGANEAGDVLGVIWINLTISVIYTVFSVARQYILRRLFLRLGYNENFYTLFKRMWCWRKK